MNDMSSVIVPKSDQINADDFIAGPQTFTIREVQIRGGQEQPVNILLEGMDKAYRPCKSMSRVLVQAWGPDAKVYAGRSLTLYRDPTVKWGGLEVGGIRISHLSHIDGKLQLQLTATRGQRKPHIIMPLVVQQQTGDRAKAEAWLKEYLASPTTGPATDKALAKLKREYPDLYAQTQAATDDPFASTAAETPGEAFSQQDGGAVDASQEGPADEQMGELDPIRAAADRLIATARAGETFSERDIADLNALPEGLRAEVDAVCTTA